MGSPWAPPLRGHGFGGEHLAAFGCWPPAALREHRPQEVYNLAAQSFVPTSWSQPVFTGEATALGVTRILEAIRQVAAEIRFYQASSSEMFGKVREVPQKDDTL